MRALLLAVSFLLLTSAASAQNFSRYPGFLDPDATVEMTTDKGLILEIVLRCEFKSDGQIAPGIMTYSKIEKLYCSSKNRCFRHVDDAVEDTCS